MIDAKRILRWTWVPVGIALLYAAVVIGMRWQSNRALEEQAVQQQARADREIVERYGNGELKVLMFYANPPQISAGNKSLLCYGVANADSVSIGPGVESVAPSLSRCVEVRPTATTTYRLIAKDSSGKEVSKSVDIAVR